ncbi:hypothetical protein C5167_011899 [Papaver somniferum]|uniref:F-box domain-containing protein n=1 Tax=Papaver somniferum TaxID=3469 RepID=A0A4Y7IVY1_PAPSO|nr:hypothetical protein C5167_011899 [Papaver somniferum]
MVVSDGNDGYEADGDGWWRWYILMVDMVVVGDGSGGSDDGVAGEIYQRTDMDSESNTYVDDGSTASKGASAVCPMLSQGMLMNTLSMEYQCLHKWYHEPDFHGSQAAILKEVISADCKGEMYQSFLDSENNTCLVDVSTTADEIFLVADSRGSPAVKSKAGEGALNTVPHYFGSRTNADEGRPYLHFERVIFGDDGPTTKESISLCNDLSVSPTVIPTSGKGEPYQRTDMDSESNTCCCDGLATEKGISFFSDIVSQAVKPILSIGNNIVWLTNNTYRDDGSTIAEAHLVGGNMVVEAVISKAGEGDFLDSERDTCRYDGLATKEAMAGEAQRAYMESLPSDILSRVPAESVLDCKLVCKRWETFIRSRNFANMHLRRLLNHLDGGEDCNHYLAANVESSLFFACRFDESKTLLYHGGQVSDRISIGEKYIYNQNLKRIYHAPMHTDLLARHFVGSCNGLVCTYQLHNEILDPIYICNPLTREYVYLPQLVVNKEDVDHLLKIDGEASMYYEMACGFGYARSTKEYKVVRIHYLDYNEGTVEVPSIPGLWSLI